jgi:hypothetical protein
MAGPAELLGRVFPEPAAHDRSCAGLGQRVRAEDAGPGIVAELAPETGPLGIRRAAGSHEQNGQALEATRDVAEESKRRSIGPVGVVDEEQQRCPVGQVGGQPMQPMQGAELRVPVPRREPWAARADEALREPGRAGEERLALGVRGGEDRLFEQLARDPEREVPLQHGSARLEHLQTRVTGGRARAC